MAKKEEQDGTREDDDLNDCFDFADDFGMEEVIFCLLIHGAPAAKYQEDYNEAHYLLNLCMNRLLLMVDLIV